MKNKEKMRENIFYISYILISCYRFSFYGYFYLPYLDDYVQYFLYPSIKNPISSILFGGVGAAFTRPLAAFLDIYFWSFFSKNLSLALIFLCVLFSVSGILFYKALKISGVNPSPLFLIFYSFLPSYTEGTFWISAATRTVPPLFFCSLAVFSMLKSKGRISNIAFYLSNLFSLLFYEQISILSFFCVALCFLSDKKRFTPHFLLAILNITVLAVYYLSFGKTGDNASRLEISADILKNFKTNFIIVSEFLLKPLPLYTKGFIRSLALIYTQNTYFWIIILFFLCFLFANFFPKNKKSAFFPLKKRLLLGFILFLLPLLPFFVLKNPWLNFRNLVPSALGLAILIDAVLSAFPKIIKPVAIALSAFLIICNVSEISDYTNTMIYDQNIIYSIAKNPLKDSLNPNIYFYPETKNNYLNQTAPYNDHIMSITGSDWGLTGTVRTVTKNLEITVLRHKKN